MKIRIVKEQIKGMPRYGISAEDPLAPADVEQPEVIRDPARKADPKAMARAAAMAAKEKAEKERKIKIAKDKEIADKRRSDLSGRLEYVRSIRVNDKKRFIKLMQAIPAGSMKDQPSATRIPSRERTLGGSKWVAMGNAPAIDSILAWTVENLRIHAETLGIIPAKSRTYLPSGPSSGYRTSEMQFKLFKRKFGWFNKALIRRGIIKNTYGKYERAIQKGGDGKYFYKDTRGLAKGIALGGKKRNLAWAIAKLTSINVARPQDTRVIQASDGSTTKVRGFPNHQTGRAIDMYFGYGLERPNNPKITATPAWQLLSKYAGMYGLANYTNEAWHWELNKANWEFLKMLKAEKISPIEYALATTIEMPLAVEPPVVEPAV
tara:strand:+ start:1726 stop:2856 length:1131 start_codon:yes stop_codon:yes gene_type:complete